MTSFLGLDIGTSSVKALLVGPDQTVLATSSMPLTVSRPRPLWSEQDPHHWWRATCDAVAALRAAAPEGWAALAGIGLSGQQHGATLLDAAGKVLRPAILWNDQRSHAECVALMQAVPDLPRRAGNIAMAGFTAPKLAWLRVHEPEIYARVSRVLLPKDYVRWRLTGAFVTDVSDASGTLWLDVSARRWDDTLLAATGMTRAQMPDLVEGSEASAHVSAELAAEWGVARVPVAGGGGDNPASAVGIGAVRAGQGFLSLGTSGVLFAVTDRYVAAPERTMHAMCHALPGRWHGMSVHLSAAASLEWIAGVIGAAGDIGGLLARVEAWATPDRRAEAPVFLPYLSGERTPHNDAHATGMFAGLRGEHGAEALVWAVLEGVAFSFADGADVMRDAGARLSTCFLVGGGARSRLWAQLLADTLGIELLLPSGAETGAAMGAARLAMLAAGAGTEADICTTPDIAARFAPQGTPPAARLQRFRSLYAAEKASRPV